MRRPLHLLPAVVLLSLVTAVVARAQSALELVDPGAGEVAPAQAPVRPPPQPEPPPQMEPPPAAPEFRPATKVEPRPRPEPVAAEPTPVAPSKPPPPPIALPTRGDDALRAAWKAWHAAFTGLEPSAEKAALDELRALRTELGIADLEAFSITLARASEVRMTANDPVSAVTLASAAVELSPQLPFAHFALARAYFGSDPADVGRYLKAAGETLRRSVADPQTLRPALGDLTAALLAAVVATALAIVLVLFGRRARYFLHDFHHLLPRSTARWQSTALAVLLVLLPLVFRMGVLPVLLALFAAVTLYLTVSERVVAAVAISLVALLPLAAGEVARLTAFAGTPAADVYRLERGGLEAADAAVQVRERLAQDRAGFEELFALGRYELRRGRIEQASDAFKKAAVIRQNDGRLLTNLGNARFALNDLEGARSLYQQATAAAADLPDAFYNLAQVHFRKAATLSGSSEAQERERGNTALDTAVGLQPELASRSELPNDGPLPLNALLLSPALPTSELVALAESGEAAGRVRDQLAWNLIGLPAGWGATLLPLVLALALAGLGALSWQMSASRACDKCGRAVCRRCDPELAPTSGLCGQCVNVFMRRGVVAPQLKVRKQIEIDRYQAGSERLTWLLGIVCSGAGHLFTGLPVRGALFVFASLYAVALAVLRDGLLRAPWGELPIALRLVPVAILLVTVYVLSLTSLRKAQAR